MSDEKKQLSKARQALVDRVLSRLDAGAMLWDNGMQGVNAMPLNAVSGARYHGMNALNLMLMFKQDPRWLTFNQAKDNGYTVKKGAKGVPIEIYKTIDKRTGKDADMPAILEEVKDMTFTERQAFKKENLQTFARNYYVFNASDVIGIEPYHAPALTPVAVSARNERIERVIEDSRCPIRYDGNGRNYYSPSSDEIHLTERAAFKSDEFFYNTALHEMAHSTGHNSRLNRPGGTFGSKAYAREELVAEIASVLIAAELGLTQSDRVIENSAEYVRSWAKDIRENPQTLIDAVIDASKATDYICDRERKREQTQERTQKESLRSNVNEWYSRQYPIDEFTNAINDHITFGDVRDAILTGNDIYSLLGVEDGTVRERVFGRLADLLDLSNKAVYNSWIENSESAETRREREIQAAMQDFPKEFADKKLLDAADAFARHTPKYSDTSDRAQFKSPPKQQQFTEHKKPLMINFYAGPSSGKTTAALELTAALKKAGYNVEYVSEYAKELVLENRVAELNDQKHITDEQYKRFDRIRNSADIIVTDSPILLGLVYGDGKIDDKYAKQIRSYYDSFDNFNMLMTRPKDAAFQSEGRVHDEKQSIELDGKMKSMLDTQGVFYGSYKRDDIAKTVERIGQTYARLYGTREKTTPEQRIPNSFKERVSAVLDGSYPSGEIVPVDDTPKLIQDAGFTPRTMAIKQAHLRDILRPAKVGNGGNRHGLSRDFMDALPEHIAEPAMVFRSLTRPNDSIVIVTNKTDMQNNPIVVALTADGISGFIDGTMQQCNLVASAYGRERFAEFVQRNCDTNNVIYYNEKKSRSVFGAIQVQFPQVLSTLDSNTILQHFSLDVKGIEQKTQKENNAATPPAPTQEPYKFKTNLDNIPDAMKALPNWVAFRTEQVDGKIKKILLSPNKGASDIKYLKWAKPNDPTTWATFDKAVAFAKKYKLDGLAFAMSGSGMTCIDLDRHLDENGKPSELAQKFIDAAQGTYIEKSVSGRGLHIFYAGERPDGYQNRNIELDLETYDSARFMSMTGNLYGNAPKEINPPSAELNSLLKSKLAKVQSYVAPSMPLGMDDNSLIDKIRSSKVGHEFDALMRGENLCGDHSVSDFKLCNMLAFFSGGDAAQVERCFRSSGLYRPQKGDAYARRTAEKACSTLSKRYDPTTFSARSGKNTKKNGGKPSGSGGNGSSGR